MRQSCQECREEKIKAIIVIAIIVVFTAVCQFVTRAM